MMEGSCVQYLTEFRQFQLIHCTILAYGQHFLSPYIDSEVNHKRHFIKIPFINKGIKFINLHSIFKDNSVISSIPNYFNNSETPIICYRYTKPIRSTIFNFNKIVNERRSDKRVLRAYKQFLCNQNFKNA